MSKEVLQNMMNQLTDEQIEEAIGLLQPLLRRETALVDKTGKLDNFLGVMVSAFSNVLYDLAKEAERSNEPITANRHNFSRKKINDAWEEYKG
jgi:hypothetical protein